MPNDTREGSTEAPVLLAWGMPATEAAQGTLEEMSAWLTGGVPLLLWTALAILLTS